MSRYPSFSHNNGGSHLCSMTSSGNMVMHHRIGVISCWSTRHPHLSLPYRPPASHLQLRHGCRHVVRRGPHVGASLPLQWQTKKLIDGSCHRGRRRMGSRICRAKLPLIARIRFNTRATLASLLPGYQHCRPLQQETSHLGELVICLSRILRR
jgi:hypothetical protein